MGGFAHLKAVSFLSLPDHTKLPLGVTDVLPQSHQQQVAFTASQEKGAGQAEEVAEGGRAESGWLEAKLFVSRAQLISQKAEQFLNLRR